MKIASNSTTKSSAWTSYQAKAKEERPAFRHCGAMCKADFDIAAAYWRLL